MFISAPSLSILITGAKVFVWVNTPGEKEGKKIILLLASKDKHQQFFTTWQPPKKYYLLIKPTCKPFMKDISSGCGLRRRIWSFGESLQQTTGRTTADTYLYYIYITIKNILGMEILLKGYFKDCSTNYEVLLERYYFTLLSQSFNHIVWT